MQRAILAGLMSLHRCTAGQLKWDHGAGKEPIFLQAHLCGEKSQRGTAWASLEAA